MHPNLKYYHKQFCENPPDNYSCCCQEVVGIELFLSAKVPWMALWNSGQHSDQASKDKEWNDTKISSVRKFVSWLKKVPKTLKVKRELKKFRKNKRRK